MELWVGRIPEIFGYGIMVFETTEKKAEKALKKALYQMRNSYGSTTTYKDACESWGGGVDEVEIGKTYYDNLNY